MEYLNYEALGKSATKLIKRNETKALNQYAAGIAALAGLTKLNVTGTNENILWKKLDELLSFQTAEGWFPEYGSFDIGYLSVTLIVYGIFMIFFRVRIY